MILTDKVWQLVTRGLLTIIMGGIQTGALTNRVFVTHT